MQESRQTRLQLLLAQLALVCLVWGVFFPILEFEFINLDVPAHLTMNPHVQGLTVENVKHILTSWCATSYYPVRTLSYAVDHQIWGMNPKGFKLTNILLHMANVVLVFWLILRMLRRQGACEQSPKPWWDVGTATLSAAVFAVHPVVVEPVTWVSGREELLMVLGALGCIHFHLSARWFEGDDGSANSPAAYHVGAAFCCALACLSNAVAAVIPLIVVVWDLLTLHRDKWARIVRGTSALWLIGVATIVLKRLGDATDPTVPEFGVFSVQRLLTVLNVYWLNLGTLAWPKDLVIDYWNVEPGGFGDAGVILGGLAIVLTCVLLWKLRRRRLAVFGLLWFGIGLGPSSQIMPHHIDRADRFLYLPLVGLAVAAGMLLRPLGHRAKRREVVLVSILMAASILVALNARSARQIQVWVSSVSLWEHSLRLIPTNAFAHSCLGEALAEQGRFPEAIEHYETSLRLVPDDVPTLSDYACRLATCRQEEYRDYDRAIVLAELGCRLSDWKDSRVRRTLAMAHMNYATSLSRRHRFGEAIHHYRAANEADPEYEVPLFNLATMLAECSDEAFRRPDEAVRLAERACTLVKQPSAVQLSILAKVYVATGRSEQAAAAIEEATQLARESGDLESAVELEAWLALHRQTLRKNR